MQVPGELTKELVQFGVQGGEVVKVHGVHLAV